MEIIIKNTAKQYPLPPADNHVARCVSIIDLGTHTEETKFGVKTNQKLRISWELPNEKAVFDKEKGEQPFMISKGFNVSMHEKASLRKFLESWRGVAFTEKELEGFNIIKLLGQPCMLNVTHVEHEGKQYANITAVSRVPKGLTCPPAITELISYSATSHNEEVFAKLPEFLQKKINECWERNEQAKKTPVVAESAEIEGQDIPF